MALSFADLGATSGDLPAEEDEPLTSRKIEAASGFVNSTRSLCSRRRPVMPAGMVATTRSQPSARSPS